MLVSASSSRRSGRTLGRQTQGMAFCVSVLMGETGQNGHSGVGVYCIRTRIGVSPQDHFAMDLTVSGCSEGFRGLTYVQGNSQASFREKRPCLRAIFDLALGKRVRVSLWPHGGRLGLKKGNVKRWKPVIRFGGWACSDKGSSFRQSKNQCSCAGLSSKYR
jgi:hypothetical protein